MHDPDITSIEELGWMLYDGRGLKSSEYPNLFLALGYKFDGKDGIFNIPRYSNNDMSDFNYIIKYAYIFDKQFQDLLGQ